MLAQPIDLTSLHTDASFPLTVATRGEHLVLVEIRAGDRLRSRLAALGLHPGMALRVVQSQPGGPLILAIHDDSRLAIGQGMAQKMMVRRAGRGGR